MIKNILRKLLPPRKSRINAHEVKFDSILANLTANERSIFFSFYSQWVIGDKQYPITLAKAPKKVQAAWEHVSGNSDRQAINAHVKKYFETNTADAVSTIEALQTRIRK